MSVKPEEAQSFAQGVKPGHSQRIPQGRGGVIAVDFEAISDNFDPLAVIGIHRHELRLDEALTSNFPSPAGVDLSCQSVLRHPV